jgi:Protein of unknown function (DUF3014)
MDEDAKRWIYWGVPIVVVVGLGAALYYGRTHKKADVEPAAQTQTAPASETPPVHHPIEDAAPDQPLPALADSDAPVQESLAGVFGRNLDPFLVTQNIVRHVVVTVDNLPRKKTAVNLWPVKPMTGELAITGAEDMMLSDANFERYAPIIKIVQNADTHQLAGLYRRYYPLFQEAYVDLGYPEGYFNDRLIEVIDHLLATPDVAGPIRLTQPGVFYQFADPSLEERSAGQKTLIRMGPAHAAAIKEKLRELRKEVAANPQG